MLYWIAFALLVVASASFFAARRKSFAARQFQKLLILKERSLSLSSKEELAFWQPLIDAGYVDVISVQGDSGERVVLQLSIGGNLALSALRSRRRI
ncbi:MAG: hypothetical protein E5X76_28955 [Mesorhizobium sp.]|nr:MAG: hypothetical protein E5X77_29200 [Mesorhizobium sp.]TJV68613.1 MAG: hypothetical protein E5X76_28955 [Mesorhizobium sp.]